MQSRVQTTRAGKRGRAALPRICYTARKSERPGNENHLLPSQLLRRMRERDEAALQLGTALFLRRMRGADGPPELFQDRRRIAALRDPGGLRIEQDTTAEFERAIEW